jgi:hypothetical protein
MARSGGVEAPTGKKRNPNPGKKNPGANPGANKGNPGKPQGPPKAPKQGRNEYAYLNLPGNKQLHEETTAATNLAYRPTERSIAAEKRASQQRTKNEGQWWNEYLATVGAGQAATQGAYQAAANQTQGIIGAASAADNAATASLNSEASQAAAARGQSATAANAATSSTANAAQATRNASIGALGARTAGQGANQYAYLGEQKRVGAGQRVQAMSTQAKKTASIEQDRTALRKERGEYAVKTLGQKQAEAREIKLKKKAFELEKHSAAASAKAEAEAARLAYQEHLQEQREKGSERNEARTQQQIENERAQKELQNENYKTHHPSATGGKSPSEKHTAQQDHHDAYVTAKNLYVAAKNPPRTDKEWAAYVVLVTSEAGVPAQIAQQAVRRLRHEIEAREKANGGTSDVNGASLGH